MPNLDWWVAFSIHLLNFMGRFCLAASFGCMIYVAFHFSHRERIGKIVTVCYGIAVAILLIGMFC
jgi:hypothetical protein